MKRVIFITQALWLGGIETALVNLVNHLNHEKFDITILITEDYRQMASGLTDQCRLLTADRNRTVSFSEPYRFKKFSDLLEKPKRGSSSRMFAWKILNALFKGTEIRLYSSYIKSNLKDEHFDTAVIYSDRVAELAVRSVNADRFIMFYHNADIGKAYHDTYGYKAAERIIAVSESQCEKLKKVRPSYADKMIAIPNYIDADTVLRRAEETVDLSLFDSEGIHLVSCGRLAHQKGFDFAIEACADIVNAGYENLHWHILGTGPDRKKLEELIKQYGMKKHFHLEGPKNNPFPYMKVADLYVQPSRSEGYSLSILEARVLACPVVATYPAAGEQLEDGVNGTLCDPNAASVAQAVLKHLNNPELSEKYRQNLLKYSFGEFNSRILSEIESLL